LEAALRHVPDSFPTRINRKDSFNETSRCCLSEIKMCFTRVCKNFTALWKSGMEKCLLTFTVLWPHAFTRRGYFSRDDFPTIRCGSEGPSAEENGAVELNAAVAMMLADFVSLMHECIPTKWVYA
jgi:hypothetical protein